MSDNEYAFKCIMFEFFKLMPNQASISYNIFFKFEPFKEV